MHIIKIFNDKNEQVYEGRFQDLLVREAKGVTTEREHGEAIRMYQNGKHALELKLWSGMGDFSLSGGLNNEVELEG